MNKLVGIALTAGLSWHGTVSYGAGVNKMPHGSMTGQGLKTPIEIKDELVGKISGFLFKVVEGTELEGASVFQTNFKKIFDKAKDAYRFSLNKSGHGNRPEEALQRDFSYIWKEAINNIVEVQYAKEESLLDKQLEDAFLADFEDEFTQEKFDKGGPGDVVTIKTVLINMVMRQKDCLDRVNKVRSLIEMGADKNLNKEFAQAAKMESQREYPFGVALNEISSVQERNAILAIMFDDSIIYANNRLLPEAMRVENIAKTIIPNKNYIAEILVDAGDFSTFNLLLTYCEMKGVQFVEAYTEEMSQIHDQLWSPILEQIMAKMRDIRRLTVSTDESGAKIDNIKEFLSSPKLRKQLLLNGDARFSEYFQERLKRDYESLFNKAAQHINTTKTLSESDGKHFKEVLLKWVRLANFRNRVAKHLNRFAMTASNEGERANVIRLIRYANIYDKASEGTDQGDLFKELHEFGGKEIIFTTKNKLKWTPAMYAMMQKQGEGITLLLKQSLNKVTDIDGLGNNIFHLAFPLPEQFFKGENVKDSENVLELVGSHLGDESARGKTTEAIKSITLENSIPEEDKIAALRQLSSSNFTPISLAAATGNLATYEFLKTYLLGQNAWNEDDHAFLGTHVEELVVDGLARYKKQRVAEGSLKGSEAAVIDSEITKRSREISKKYATCIHDIYRADLPEAVVRLKKIEAVAMGVITEFNGLKATKRREQPYKKALEAAIEKMLKSKHKLLRGMRESTSIVKASYLGPVVKMLTKEFLTHKPTPHDMTFAKVYEGLTGSIEPDFFASSFNETVERRMQKIIFEAVKAAGRLREEILDEGADNRFRHVEELYISHDEDQGEDAASHEIEREVDSGEEQWDI